jgi:hypothetical protein
MQINFIEIENQRSYTALDGLFQILDCSLERRSRYLRIIERLGSELSRTPISDFALCDWCVSFRRTLSSLSRLVEPTRYEVVDTRRLPPVR